MATVEQRLEDLEASTASLAKSQKRYRFATIGLLCLVIAGVSMGQTRGVEDIVCRSLRVVQSNGKSAVMIGSSELGGRIRVHGKNGKVTTSISRSDDGTGHLVNFSPSEQLVSLLGGTNNDGGILVTYSSSGKRLVVLRSSGSGTNNDGGMLTTYSQSGKPLIGLGATTSGGGGGMLTTYSQSGKPLIGLGATTGGGLLVVSNKTGEGIVTLAADDYGNGTVGAWNRKGEGRTLTSQ
jgi:hypothetical protein